MPTYYHYDSPAGRIAVRFIASYRGVADYGLVRCGGEYLEARLHCDVQENLSVTCPEDFERDHQFTLVVGMAVLREHLRAMFDRDVRELVRLGLLAECDDPRATPRARELGLIP